MKKGLTFIFCLSLVLVLSVLFVVFKLFLTGEVVSEISETKIINVGQSKIINGLNIYLVSAYVIDISFGATIQIPGNSIDFNNNHPTFQMILEEKSYVLELISATSTSATIKITTILTFTCGVLEVPCSDIQPCCSGLSCINNLCRDLSSYSCNSSGQSCTFSSDCCSGLGCCAVGHTCNVVCPICEFSGQSCTSNTDCCSLLCSDGACVDCIPDCTGKECGNDGCGNNWNCGICSSGKSCSNGVCVSEDCVPETTEETCGILECGNKINNCGEKIDCGSCDEGFICFEGSCVPVCSDGTLAGQCSTTKPKYCDDLGNLIDNCLICGCPTGYNCQEDGSCLTNAKDMSRYSDKEVFLVSDKEWKNVLPFVPVTTWTGNEECQRGYGTLDNVCVYPTLIYHEEETGFDVDSIIYFMQQYSPSKVTIIGETSQELDNLLITQPDLGAGLNVEQIQTNFGDYLFYWESFQTVVYVEDNYELALLASTYASLINAPLIIEGTTYDSAEVFSGRNIICVGSVFPSGSSCSEQYTLEQLQQKYVDETNTDKIILVNPNDLDIKVEEEFQPEKSGNPVYEIYSKTSLASPILASAKHEVILSTTATDYEIVDSFIEEKIDSLGINVEYLTILASPNVIPYRENMGWEVGGFFVYRALDQTQYADMDNDKYPDIYTGRIMGISSSDISSYVSRDLFYDNLEKTSNTKFMASAIYSNVGSLNIDCANRWSSEFENAGYNSASVTSTQSCYQFEPNEWVNQNTISYSDHGNSNWAGIYANEMPFLDNPLVFTEACLTCSTYDGHSFCSWTIRQGALGYLGAVSLAFGGNRLYRDTMNNIYYYTLSSGEAFTKSFDYFKPSNPGFGSYPFFYMTTFLGDPTFEVKPIHTLKNPLTWWDGGNDYNCGGQ